MILVADDLVEAGLLLAMGIVCFLMLVRPLTVFSNALVYLLSLTNLLILTNQFGKPGKERGASPKFKSTSNI